MIRSVNITSSISRSAGGLFESVRRLVQELSLTPMILSVLGTSDAFTDKDIKAWDPIFVQAFKPVGHQQFGYSPRFSQYLNLFQPDLIHTHGIWTYSSIATLSYHRKRKVPYVISPHGMIDPWAIKNSSWKKIPAYYLYEGSHLTNAACMRALCESEADSFRAYGLKNPIAIIPNGIDLPEEGKGEEVNAKGENGVKTLLFLGRIHPKKGLSNAIRAFAKALDARRSTLGCSVQWQFVIAGWDQGGHEAELMNLCDELGLSFSHKMHETHKGDDLGVNSNNTSVLFHGSAFGEKKDDLLRSADAFILSSFSEGLPMSVLEAWAYGVPVLMTQECNLPEGFAADAALKIGTDVESIDKGMDELFSMSEADLSTMGAKGRKLVEERFTWKKVAAQMAGVYEWMLGGGVPPDCVSLHGGRVKKVKS